MENSDGKGRVGEDSLDHVLADHERNVGMVRERGFRVAEHGSSGPLEVGDRSPGWLRGWWGRKWRRSRG